LPIVVVSEFMETNAAVVRVGVACIITSPDYPGILHRWNVNDDVEVI
jgi:hypothetical protein